MSSISVAFSSPLVGLHGTVIIDVDKFILPGALEDLALAQGQLFTVQGGPGQGIEYPVIGIQPIKPVMFVVLPSTE